MNGAESARAERAELKAVVRDAVMAGRSHIEGLPCPACDPRVEAVLAAVDAYVAAQDSRPAPELAEVRDALERVVTTYSVQAIHVIAADMLVALGGASARPEPKPAPELAAAMAERDKARADRNRARNAVCNLLDLFGAPDERLMQHASITRGTLLRYATEAGVRLDGLTS